MSASDNDNAKVSGDARVSGDVWVSGDARVSGDAWVSGNARVSGNATVFDNARVSDNAWVFGDARVLAGLIDGDAKIAGPQDLVQVIVDDVCHSTFRCADGGWRETSSDGSDIPEAVSAALKALAAGR